MRVLIAIITTIGVAGCATRPLEIGREPLLTPVGAGLQPDVVPHPPSAGFNALYSDQANLFRDPRAMRPGDVLTVNIFINDKASLGNNTDRSLDSEVTNNFDVGFGSTFTKSLKLNGQFDTTSKSSANGQASIDRSEKIQVSVGAVVTETLPNGNLVISGSQEVRVNFELRQLNIAGIVRPRDISKDNTISYDKIAEARISYGGRGRLTEVQQPGWGHQIYDTLKPF